MSAEKINYGLSEKEIYSAVTTFLKRLTDLPIIISGQNAPVLENSIVITMLYRNHKSTVSTRYDENGEVSRRTTLIDFQVDIYGQNAGQVYDAILVLGQNQTSYEIQREQNPNIELVEIIERGRQPFVNEQKNYENRYTLEMRFSVFNELSRTIEYIDKLNVKITEVK